MVLELNYKSCIMQSFCCSMTACGQRKQCWLRHFSVFRLSGGTKSSFTSNGNVRYHRSLRVISRGALCSCSPLQLTARAMQRVPGCLGDTQCQQRALRLQSVCFLYLSVSSPLLSEHTVSHCAGLLVLSWNPKHPSWAAVDLGDCPCYDIGLPVGNMNVSVSFWSFVKHIYYTGYKTTLQQCNTTALGSRKPPPSTRWSWNHDLLKKCDATLRLKQAGRSQIFSSPYPSLAPFLHASHTVCSCLCTWHTYLHMRFEPAAGYPSKIKAHCTRLIRI